MKLLKGIIHVHSTYSYDGQHTIEEIGQYARARGYSFIGMSEHSDTLNEEKMAEYVKECQSASSPDCLVIPGIEFTCENNLHLIGLGMRNYTESKDPLYVSEFIQRNGGIAIIAHPKRYNYKIPRQLVDSVDGIEVWNARYDGRFVPNYHSLKLLKALKKHKRSILAFGGQDLHQIIGHFQVQVFISCESLEEAAILESLRKGDFAISNPYFQLESKGEPEWLKRQCIVIANHMYSLAKGIRNCLQRSIV